jgi:hypothetical protein
MFDLQSAPVEIVMKTPDNIGAEAILEVFLPAATLATDRLEVLQADDESLSITKRDALHFGQQPVHVYVLDPETNE